MKLTINIENENVYQSLTQFLNSVGIKTVSSEKKQRKIIDEVTLISEKTLAEEWNSKEDKEWDKTNKELSSYKKNILSVSVWSEKDIKSLENNLKNLSAWKIEKW